jgi:intracellular septation protein
VKFLFDFFPVLLFFVAFKLYDIFVATAIAIIASFIQVGFYWLRFHRFETMHLITLGIIVIFGGATLLLKDELFIKWKPTVLNWLFALVFLGSHFIGKKPIVQRMMANAITLPAAIWHRLNLVWVVFFIVIGFINIYVAYNFETEIWVNFKVFGILGLTLAFVVMQSFFIARHIKPDEDTGKE